LYLIPRKPTPKAENLFLDLTIYEKRDSSPIFLYRTCSVSLNSVVNTKHCKQ
jgi:hypothetical protein